MKSLANEFFVTMAKGAEAHQQAHAGDYDLICRQLHDLAAGGKAIVVVSSELQELVAICDRIAVLSAGRLVETFERGDWTEDRILAAAFSEHARSLQGSRPHLPDDHATH